MQSKLSGNVLLRVGLLSLLVVLLGFFTEAQATHIRAGDITAKRDTTPNPNPLRFFFTMKIYTDRGSDKQDFEVDIQPGVAGVILNVPRLGPEIPVGDPADNVDVAIYKWEYTYPAAGSYTTSWTGINRNGGILNMTAPSDQQTFYISTTININPLRGFNSTPVLTVPPVDLAAVGRIYVHNPGAYDADGDSLSFKLRVPQQRTGPTPTGIIGNVPGYVLPSLFNGGCNQSIGSGKSYLTLDVINGQLVWDAPCIKGEYNIAFVVEEWRVSDKGAIKLGEVVRDMQIIVKETPNRPPKLAPKDTCIVAGTTLRGIIRATDPDNDFINLTAIGGILPPATFRQTSKTAGNATGEFVWSTNCSDVRERPYQVIFKAEDVKPINSTKLADLQPWNIKVVGPPPQNLAAFAANRNVTLTWEPYICQNASKIRIYRREGPSGFVPDHCETGVPARTGYKLIAEVNASEISYFDNNNGKGLESGTEYCYIIYAEFPGPGRGKSLASNEACLETDQSSPFLTNVTVDKTDRADGQLTIKWTKPRITDNLTQPLEYRLFRKEGMQPGAGYTEVRRTQNLNDTVFTETGLNTTDKPYRYRLEFYQSATSGGNPSIKLDTTEASSVYLRAVPESGTQNSIKLDWTYQVPWNNAARKHLIYRKENQSYVLIDSVLATATGGTYTDRGTFGGKPLDRGQVYCYYVQTVGAYDKPGLPAPLRNNSQEVCTSIDKLVCAPILSIDALNCDLFKQSPGKSPYQNKLAWQPQLTANCTDQIAYYTVYFKPTLNLDFTKLGTTTNTEYVHDGLESYAGCYVVTATSTDGQESAYSNEVCKDNCFSFILPNIITPNGDGLNDTFRPDKNTFFVKSTKFKVFNRWGVLVYERNSQGIGDDVYINWPGTNKNGDRLTDGIYYYEVEVEFYTIDPDKAFAKYKGWVEIVR